MKPGKLTAFFSVIALLVFFVGAGSAANAKGSKTPKPAVSASVPIYSDTLIKLSEKSVKETVLVTMEKGSGSGIVWTADGYILTNAHVVGNEKTARIRFIDGTVLEGKVVGTPDVETDVAVIKVEPPSPLSAAPIADSNNVRRGEMVYAIGEPFGLDYTLTAGVVSGLHRNMRSGAQETIQTDAALNPGNSGGPLYNMNGEVIAMNVSIVPRGNTVSFSIPINDVIFSARSILKNGKVVFGRLGAGLIDLAEVQSEEAAKAVGLSWPMAQKTGVYIREVVPKGPADVAGLKVGDITVSLNGVAITDSFQFKHLVSRSAIGVPLPLIVLRNGTEVTLTVSLAGREPEKSKEFVEDEDPEGPAPKSPGDPKLPEKQSFPNFGKGIMLLPPAVQSAVRNSQGMIVARMKGSDGKAMTSSTNAFLVDSEYAVTTVAFLGGMKNPEQVQYVFNNTPVALVALDTELGLALFKLQTPEKGKKPVQFSERVSVGKEYYSIIIKDPKDGNSVPYSVLLVNQLDDDIFVFPVVLKLVGIGAPVFNEAGQAVGMWIYVDKDPSDPADIADVSYAISSTIIKDFIKEAKKKGSREPGKK
ncbi:MAG: hypothetical protein A3H69_04485 [Candidatus Sungbacteria bacterium RIFCSPLOWO2_02_FULL_47_9]|nr:MAG: hypothetical protein A3H69_04485 [Candidatus Sungbacteria bacterium RIFCSPLOWO2_02_FULL_47_9]